MQKQDKVHLAPTFFSHVPTSLSGHCVHFVLSKTTVQYSTGHSTLSPVRAADQEGPTLPITKPNEGSCQEMTLPPHATNQEQCPDGFRITSPPTVSNQFLPSYTQFIPRKPLLSPPCFYPVSTQLYSVYRRKRCSNSYLEFTPLDPRAHAEGPAIKGGDAPTTASSECTSLKRSLYSEPEFAREVQLSKKSTIQPLPQPAVQTRTCLGAW